MGCCQSRPQSAGSPLSPLGVSIEFVRMFKAEHLKDANAAMTTSDACVKIVIPLTAKDQCAFIDLYKDMNDENGKPYLAPATVFVSHAWKYKIEEPIDAMEQHERDRPKSYFWFDLFVNNQNIAAKLPQEWWSTTFRDSIKKIGCVMLVCSPWNNPVPLTRAWCLWEIMCALDQEGVEFVVVLPLQQITELLQGVFDQPKSVVQALADIQAEKADAFKKTDKEMIFLTIQKTVGFTVVNQKVKDKLREWYIRVLVLLGKEAGKDGKSERAMLDDAILLNQIGVVLLNFNGADDALVYFNKSLNIRSKILGATHSDIAVSLNNIGLTYDSKGDYGKALEYYTKCIAIPNFPTLAYNNIGIVHAKLGHPDESLRYLQLSHDMIVKEYGEEDENTAMSCIGLGDAHLLKSQFDQALSFIDRALKIYTKTVGENHPSTASAYESLSVIYQRKGDIEKCIEFAERCLKIRITTLGDENPVTADSHSALGLALTSGGRFTEATTHLEKALAVYLKTQGETHINVARCYNNMGLCAIHQGQASKAVEYFSKCVPIYSATLGTQHMTVATIFSNLGMAHSATGDFDKAVEASSKAVSICESLGTKDHADTAAAWNSLAMASLNKGDNAKALEGFKKAREIFSSVYGPTHKDAITALGNIGETSRRLGQFDEALSISKQILEARIAQFGEKHAETAAAQNNLGMVYFGLKDYAQARRHFELAIEAYEWSGQRKTVNVANVYGNLGSAFELDGDAIQGYANIQSSQMIFEEILGPDHPSTIAAENHMNDIIESQ